MVAEAACEVALEFLVTRFEIDDSDGDAEEKDDRFELNVTFDC